MLEAIQKAIQKALERDGPAELAYWDEVRDSEWASEGLMEFPNLGNNEKPEVEEEVG